MKTLCILAVVLSIILPLLAWADPLSTDYILKETLLGDITDGTKKAESAGTYWQITFSMSKEIAGNETISFGFQLMTADEVAGEVEVDNDYSNVGPGTSDTCDEERVPVVGEDYSKTCLSAFWQVDEADS